MRYMFSEFSSKHERYTVESNRVGSNMGYMVLRMENYEFPALLKWSN
jgi:hypothetical protein